MSFPQWGLHSVLYRSGFIINIKKVLMIKCYIYFIGYSRWPLNNPFRKIPHLKPQISATIAITSFFLKFLNVQYRTSYFSVLSWTTSKIPNQSGFKVTHPTTSTLLAVTENLYALHQPKCHQSSLLDLSRNEPSRQPITRLSCPSSRVLELVVQHGGGLLITWRDIR